MTHSTVFLKELVKEKQEILKIVNFRTSGCTEAIVYMTFRSYYIVVVRDYSTNKLQINIPFKD